MDGQTLGMILKLIIFLPFVLFLIYLSLKYGGNKLQNFQNGKFIKIIERVQVSKDNSLLIAEIGDKTYLMSSTTSGLDIKRELTEDEIVNLKAKEEISPIKDYGDLLKLLKNKINIKKVDKYEDKKEF